MKELNIIISGVGGQGNILLEQIIGQAAMGEGYQVRAADTFGAAQRGGSVLSHLRLGHEISSCLIPWGGSHIVLGLEPSEALSAAAKFLRPDGLVVVNTAPVLPAKVKTGEMAYPSFDVISDLLKKLTKNIIHLDATALARENGTERSMNVVMLGALTGSGALPFSPETVKQAILKQMGPKLAELNYRPFEAGLAVGQKHPVAGF